MQHLKAPPSAHRLPPHITALPHLSAPIDDHAVVPRPPWRLRDRLLLAGGLIVLAGIGLAVAFVRAVAMH